MSVEQTRAVMERYVASEHTDLDALAEDVRFTVMATGQVVRGRDAVAAMLGHFYRGAFDAVAEPRSLVIGDGIAIGEWDFVGTHIGEFAGVAATGREVRVPLAVAYDVADGRIARGRVYFETPAFLAQVNKPEAKTP